MYQILLIYMVLVIVSFHPIVLTITKPLLGENLNSFSMNISAFIASLFNVDLGYAASSVLQYVSEIYETGHSAIAFIWQTMYGFVSLIAPTSIILMSILSYLDISYGKWLKSNWKFILEILACCLIVTTIVVIRL